jgi:hypothetical protein
MDSAMYFLARHRSVENVSRLQRGLGLAELQIGDWPGAEKALTAAGSDNTHLGTDERLALLESKVRAKKPLEELNLLLEEIETSTTVLNSYQSDLLKRLKLEIDLRSRKPVTDEAESILPSHVLFEAASRLQEAGKQEEYQSLMKKIAETKTGWGELAEISLQVEEMKIRVETVKSIAKRLP